ncbi:hypothetical protein GcC1_152003 [Golovinomyces cichoracearum]|uniref:Deacetylase complex subunit protein n=1 Tax=Golovinomyces cichoracearum TaxID=62708 RepID=A0A420HWH2_9PEZI|nr:hypothetical protein GcC1_152003 [Golovinomyces cichoracearum]
MTRSHSPQLSPVMSSRGFNSHQSNSSASQPHISHSKKDRKRSMIRDSFSVMEEGFSANKDSYYRIHLQKLQIDMNLIASADPLVSGVLPNDPSEIERLVRNSTQPNKATQLGADFPVGAGRVYAEFAKDCNDAMEERDTALAILHRNVAVRMTDIQSTYNYYKTLALNEHKALRTTLRDRLINSITNKKIRLTKEKEIDVTESTALLLHPSQFGISNPSSPGGIHSKRATRNRRDVDETISYSDPYKRKRKTHDRDESPISTRQRYENGSGVPSWLAEKNNLVATQIESPLYSIEKLFTEKELAMTYNTAALAAYSYIVRHNEPESSPNDASSKNLDTDKTSRSTENSEAVDTVSSGSVGVSMERQPSHATRNTRVTYNSGFGIDAFDDVTSPSNFEILTRQIPKLPNIMSQSGLRNPTGKPETAPPAAGLSSEDINIEMELIRRARQLNEQRGLGRNLQIDEQALRLLSEAAFPKDGRGRERWVVSENKENLHFTHKPGKIKERDIIGGGEVMSKKGSQA